MKKKKCIIIELQEIFKRMIFVENTKEKQHAEWEKKFKLSKEQFDQLVQAKLDRMPKYRHQVDTDDFFDLL